MRFIFCTFSVSILEQLTDLLDSKEIKDYQVIGHALSRSSTTDPRLDNPVWPGHNSIITIQTADVRQAETVIDIIKDFNRHKAAGKDEYVTLCSWDIENFLKG